MAGIVGGWHGHDTRNALTACRDDPARMRPLLARAVWDANGSLRETARTFGVTRMHFLRCVERAGLREELNSMCREAKRKWRLPRMGSGGRGAA